MWRCASPVPCALGSETHLEPRFLADSWHRIRKVWTWSAGAAAECGYAEYEFSTFFWPERRGNVLCSKCSLRRRSTWDRIFSPPLLSKRTAPKHKDRNVRECEAQSLGEPSGRAEHNLTHQSQGGHKHPAGGGVVMPVSADQTTFPF